MRFDTRLVQSGQRGRAPSGDVVAPIHLATTYERTAQDPVTHYYGRGENPTREELEACLAGLESVRFATVFSSGQAAAAALLATIEPGERVVVSDDVYAGTRGLLDLAASTGVRVDHVELSDGAVAAAALGPGSPAAMVWVETPSNPRLKVTDLEVIAGLARRLGARVVVDNTFAGPAVQQPLRFADVSLYSTTKSISGHLDAIGGAVVHDDEALHAAVTDHRTLVGSVPSPFDCHLIRRGLKTLSVRVERQVASAAEIAAALELDPMVSHVHYPGRPDHPGHDVAARQMSAPGSIVSFEYAGDVGKLLERFEVFAAAVSLGGVQSLVECPARMSQYAIDDELLAAAGVSPQLVRLSIGIEDVADLVADLHAALPEE